MSQCPCIQVRNALYRSLPRVGIHMGVASQLGQATWYGLGPHECHWDRKFGALLRRYGPQPVESLHTPYIVPGGH